MLECKNMNKTSTMELMEMTRKNWLSHDARWQMAVVKQFGWEAGNALNEEVIRDMARTMMYRYLKVVRVTKLQSMEEFIEAWKTVIDLSWTSEGNYDFNLISPKRIQIIIRECPVYESVKKAGVAKQYECVCNAFREGLFSAVNLNFKQEITHCLKNGDNICQIDINFLNPEIFT